MNSKIKASALIISFVYSGMLQANVESESNNTSMRTLKLTPKVIQAHEMVCAEYGGIDVSDRENSKLEVSPGTIDALVCAGSYFKPSVKQEKAGIFVFGKNDSSYIYPTPKKEQYKWQSSSVGSGSGDKNIGLTVYAPSGRVPFGMNFKAYATAAYDPSFTGVWSTVFTSIPADRCSFSYHGMNPPSPLRWFITCNALVIGGIGTTSGYNDVNGKFARASGSIIQYRR